MPLGIFAGFSGTVVMYALAICQALFEKIKGLFAKITQSHKIATVITNTLGGFFIGCIALRLPLTFGDGSEQLFKVIRNGRCDRFPNSEPVYSGNFLIATAAGKALTLAISLGSGFSGGQVLPTMLVGTCIGLWWHQQRPERWSCFLTVPVFTAAVPAAFIPAPFFFVGLVDGLFILGPEMAAPIFVAVLVSAATSSGLGLFSCLVQTKFIKLVEHHNQYLNREKTSPPV